MITFYNDFIMIDFDFWPLIIVSCRVSSWNKTGPHYPYYAIFRKSERDLAVLYTHAMFHRRPRSCSLS